MINLIPKEEKKKIIMDFRYRRALLFFITFDVCLLVALISITPAYFLSLVKENSISLQLIKAKEEVLPEGIQESLAVANDINNKITVIENAEKNKFLLSGKIINTIVLNKDSDIRISQIAYENNPDEGKKAKIIGIASSQAALLVFHQALEDNPNFTTALLTITDSARSSAIQFYITLTPA